MAWAGMRPARSLARLRSKRFVELGQRRDQIAADKWLSQGTPDARKQLLRTIQQGVFNAHESIIAEAEADAARRAWVRRSSAR